MAGMVAVAVSDAIEDVKALVEAVSCAITFEEDDASIATRARQKDQVFERTILSRFSSRYRKESVEERLLRMYGTILRIN